MVSSASLKAACFVTFVASVATLGAQRERVSRARKAETLHREELVERATAQRHRFTAAGGVVERLAAGEMPLAAAVVELQSVFQTHVRAIVLDLGRYIQGRKPTDHEVLAYYAISKIRKQNETGPPCRTAALLRLEDEYRVLFDRPAPAE